MKWWQDELGRSIPEGQQNTKLKLEIHVSVQRALHLYVVNKFAGGRPWDLKREHVAPE